MNLKKSMMTAAIAGSLTGAVEAQTSDGQTYSAEEQKVMNTVLGMTSAFHKKDITGVMESYEPGALVIFEPKAPQNDEKIIKEMFEGIFTLNPQFTYSGHEVFVNHDIAIHIAPWVMEGTAPDGSKVNQSGLSIAVLRKQKDGNWLMIFDDPHGQILMNQ